MGNSLQFMDCPGCGKRVRTNANTCHHCHRPLAWANSEKATARPGPTGEPDDELGDQAQAHYALSGGGYDTENDDFDYDSYVAEEFPDPAAGPQLRVKPWIWITAWVLIIATLLPFFYYFLIR